MLASQDNGRNYADRYYQAVKTLCEQAHETQQAKIQTVASILSRAIQASHMIWTFGCTHSAMMAAELYYRAGGLVPIKGIFGPGLWLNEIPVSRTSALEGLEGYGEAILDGLPLEKDDVIIIASTSGRNAVPLEVALKCKEKGLIVVALTSIGYSSSVSSRHSSGKRLYEVADIVLDNGAPKGDALITFPDYPNYGKAVGPCSTVIGALILNEVVVQTVANMLEAGMEPPTFVSGNIDGGTKSNKQFL